MVHRINKATFTGSGKVFDGTLANIVIGLAQSVASRAVSSLTDITDNGGGTNDAGGVRSTPALSAFQAGTGDGVAKAEFETSCGQVRDALKELLAKVSEIRTKVPAFDSLTDNLGGAATDGTIAAIDDSMTGTDAGGSLVRHSGAVAVVNNLNSRTAQLVGFVNRVRNSVGLPAIASELSYDGVSSTFAAVSTDTGSAVSGADAGANATISKAQADAVLDVMSDNVKTLSTALNAVTSDANANAPLTVVAV